MNEADDNVVEVRDLDQLFEEVLAGEVRNPDAPAWCGDLARLVAGARAEAAPGELAAQDDIVSRMVAVRQELPPEGDVAPGVIPVLTPVPAPTAPTAPTVPTRPTTALAAVPAVSDADAPEGAGPYVPRHARGYRAKHAADRMQTSTNPTVRYVGRVIAVKAAAVTTAVVIGTVAAAAATTGIVANVVVPAFTDESPDAPPTGKATITSSDDRDDSGGAGQDDAGVDVTVAVPTCQLTPVCSPLTPANPGQGPALARPTGPTVPTTEPAPTTTTTEAPAPTTTTETPPTTAPEPATTTTTETPPPTDPEPTSTLMAFDPDPAPAP